MGVMKTNLSTDPITDGAALDPVEKTFFDDLAKKAEELSVNEDSVEGTAPEPFPVEDREQGSEASWGEEAGPSKKGEQPEPHFSSAARRQFIQGREEMLSKLFVNKGKDAKETVRANFSTRDYESSSPQLKKASIETLREKVARVTGRD